MANIPLSKLNGGNSIPLLGYGTGTAWYKRAPGDLDLKLVNAIKMAIRLGYTHLDGAEVYGTEAELGQAIKESGVERSKLFVTTKVITGIADIPAAFEASLTKLQLDYVDLYLIHSPFFAKSNEDFQETWAQMEEIKRSGRALSIGVSNFLPQHLAALLKTAKSIPAINQIEYHPYLQHHELLAFQKKYSIPIAAYAPLTPVTRAKGGPLDGLLQQLALKYGVSEAAIALRWVIDQGIVAITTSGKEDRLTDYLTVNSFQLSSEEVEEISRVGDEKHFRAFWQNKFSADDRS
ncbi:MAG: hypothetical protein M1829_004089 [Trizodia sp. TS-e1964]|nr:MAG: hypothetical protein M1829_004089 [Trizodia sp. TS-e1964]